MEQRIVGETKADLQSDAHEAAADLVRAELALVRREFRDDIKSLEASGVAFGTAVVAGVLGAHALVETFIISGHMKPWRGLLASGALLGLSAVAAVVGYRALPKRTIERIAGANPGMQVFNG
jgi:hypothetical protein